MTPTLTVVILTYNEEAHIARAIESVRSVAGDVIVVDSFSTDATVAIVKSSGARLFQNPFVTQAQQFQWALENIGIAADWTMRLDADEYIEKDLQQSLLESLAALPPDVNGVNLKRKHIFMDRWIRHGGRYPLLMMRIWRTGTARVENRLMDEHMFLTNGKAVTLAGGFADHNLHGLSRFVQKHTDYATREALQVVIQNRRATAASHTLSRHNSSLQAVAKRFVKNSIYNKMPFTLSAPLYFAYRYFLQLGFLDGRQGAIYHVLQGFWYRFLVGAKIYELERALAAGRFPDGTHQDMISFVLAGLDDGGPGEGVPRLVE